jgi:hypothetical protein
MSQNEKFQGLLKAMKAKRAVHDPIILAIVQSVRADVMECLSDPAVPPEEVQDAYFVDRAAEAADDVIEAALINAYRRGAEAMRGAAVGECWAVSDEMASAGDMLSEQGTAQTAATRIRALPIPEDKQALEFANNINPCRMFP